MHCLKCGSPERRKNGFYEGRQKWQCKDCGHTSCRLQPRGAPVEIIRLALTLVLEGLGFCATARTLTSFGYPCTENAVIGWVRKYADKAKQVHSATKPQARVIQIDEMFTYVRKKTANRSCGWLLMPLPDAKLPRVLVIAPPEACAN